MTKIEQIQSMIAENTAKIERTAADNNELASLQAVLRAAQAREQEAAIVEAARQAEIAKRIAAIAPEEIEAAQQAELDRRLAAIGLSVADLEQAKGLIAAAQATGVKAEDLAALQADRVTLQVLQPEVEQLRAANTEMAAQLESARQAVIQPAPVENLAP